MVQLSNLTDDQLIEREADLSAKLDEAREVFLTAQNAFHSANDKVRAVRLEIESRSELTLETALETYIASGENTRGMKWLDNRSWKGEWKDTGLRYCGSYWHATNQRCLSVYSNFDWDDAQLAIQERVILEVVEVLKTGALEHGSIILKDQTIQCKDLKVFEISDRGCNEHANYKLALALDGTWVIFDSYRLSRYGGCHSIMFGSTLLDCLKYIRGFLYNEGPDRMDED